MKREHLYEYIVKELMSEASVAEQKALEEHFAGDTKHKSSWLSVKEYWNNFYPKTQSNHIIAKTEKKLGFTYRNNLRSNTKNLLGFAAAILVVVSFAYSAFHFFKPKHTLELKEYSCSAGELKEITLSDGTKVWLNSMSLLIASEPFTGDTREVKLFGEAYFEVFPNPEQPFIVKTHMLKTEVLGTHFNVVAYPTDEVHEIALHEGKVQLNTESNVNNKIILNPGERAYFTTKTGQIDVIRTDLGEPAQWRDGILRFYDEDLFSITKKLERKFHTRIFIADSLVGKLKYSAEFEEETLEKVLVLLSEAQEFTYEIKNNGVIIASKLNNISTIKTYTN